MQTTSPRVDYLESCFVNGGRGHRPEGPITRRQDAITLSFLAYPRPGGGGLRRRRRRQVVWTRRAVCISNVSALSRRARSRSRAWHRPRARADTPRKSRSRYRLSSRGAPIPATFLFLATRAYFPARNLRGNLFPCRFTGRTRASYDTGISRERLLTLSKGLDTCCGNDQPLPERRDISRELLAIVIR